MSRASVAVVMITLNEERNLPDALASVADFVEEVFIVDSCSTDATVDIALDYGARIVQRRFTDFGDHWNWALQNLPIKSEWTLILAPDERITDGLKSEIRSVLSANSDLVGYTVRWRLWFMGKPLHVISDVVRLWRTGRGKMSDVIVNENLIVDGPIGRLKGIIEHVDTPTLHHWYEKQNRYSTMEAITIVKGNKLSARPRLFGSRLERRMFLKKYFFRIPLRYQLQWLHELLGRGAWRDGRVGITWARLRVEARRMREIKAREMRQTGFIPDIPRAAAGDFDVRVLDSKLQKLLLPETVTSCECVLENSK